MSDAEKKYSMDDWPIPDNPVPTPRKFPGETRYQILFGDPSFRDEETKTQCPTCKGSGKDSIERWGETSYYSFRVCNDCRGEGMVTASKAKRISGTRRVVSEKDGSG